MRAFFITLAIALSACVGSLPAQSQSYDGLIAAFDARDLTAQDKRFLQAALAFEGYYNGLLDGAWGARSQDALETYARREFNEPAQAYHMALLAVAYYQRFLDDGWNVENFDDFGVSFLVPTTAVTVDAPTEHFMNWHHDNSSLSYSMGATALANAQGFHDYTAGWHSHPQELYNVRRQDLAITAARSKNGAVLYTRSDLIRGRWVTIMLSADARDEPVLNAVAASISPRWSEPVMFTQGGSLDRALNLALTLFEETEGEPGSAASQPNEAQGGSGSGFFVSDLGHVLTNAHVVSGCSTITVDGAQASLIAESGQYDLALLRTTFSDEDRVALFASRSAKLNSDVTVAGYPLAGILSGFNVTRGAISSLSGLGGDISQMQITAPVQPGNSGGPVVSDTGAVVGVVVSKLDALRMADAIGDIPQNVNFAVRGEIAELFLAQNGVGVLVSEAVEIESPIELAEQASQYTVFIECR